MYFIHARRRVAVGGSSISRGALAKLLDLLSLSSQSLVITLWWLDKDFVSGSYAPRRERGKTEGPGLSRAKLSSVVETPRSRRCYESRISAKWYRASCYFNSGTTVPLCVYVLYDMVGYRVASKHVFRKRNRRIDCPFARDTNDFATLWRVSLEMSVTQVSLILRDKQNSSRQSYFIFSIIIYFQYRTICCFVNA